MRNSILYIFLVFCLISLSAWSQTEQSATDYFNTASQQYIGKQKIEALKTIEEGLAHHQDDQKLLDLAEKLLKEDENKQDQKQQDQQKQQDKKQDEQEKEDQNKNDKGQDKEDKKDGEGEKDKKENQDKKDGNKNDKSEEEKKKEQEAQQKKMNPSQKNQAMQDLKALENKEKALLKRINVKKEKGTPVKTEKDW